MLFSLGRFLAVALACAGSVSSNHGRHHRHHRGTALASQTPWEPRKLLSRQSGQTGGVTSTSSSNGDYTCGPGRPCGNGACCGTDGWCGFGPTYCGEGCQSNCDAKAECGEYAPEPGAGCPLNVCCSEFGFCGTTSEFCGDGCQSHCKQPKPNVKDSDPRKIVIGYYEGWNMGKPCGTMDPEDIPIRMLTHVFFSFGFISPGTFQIENMADFQPSLFGRVTDLKMNNPDLKVLIALGGWTHNDPGPYQKVFSDMASTAANRKIFIRNILGFMMEYGFDGVDIDWEYPGAEDRGGIPEDGENFTLLLQELKAAFDGRYILTFTAPTSYWYLRHFDIQKSARAVDWVNLMSYDLHGVWDRENPIGSQVLGHSNITEIDLALDLFWRNNIPPSKIVLGTGFYGRTFALEDSSCTEPGCQFSGPGAKGPCTGTAGFLSYKEVRDMLRSNKAKAKFDKQAAVKYFTYGQHSFNSVKSGSSSSSSSSSLAKRDDSEIAEMDMSSVLSWISYDDASTIETKVDFASQRGLQGVMTWAIDLDDEQGELIQSLSGGEMESIDDISIDVTDFPGSVSHTMEDPTQCYISGCEEFCKSGYTAVGRSNTDLNGRNRCDTGDSSKARRICCPSFSGPEPDDCRWDDSRSSAYKGDCSGKCDVGEILIVNDSFGWEGSINGGEYGDRCSRGAKSFCCKAGNMEQYLNICTWTKCGGDCPSDRPYELTTDSGGPKENSRCTDATNALVDPQNAKKRRLCCPSKDSFRNCGWESAKVCSSTCGLNQITLDLDPRGETSSNNPCHNGRQKAFCCDPPGGLNSPFLPVDLENLFPPEYRPSPDALPTFELVSFGGKYTGPTKDEDPNNSGVAFFLVAGSYTAVTSMSKRDNPGLEFLNCPADVLSRPNEEHQTARVVCYSENVPDCFRVQEGGVEGTVVQMPEECGGPSWARAVSLNLSKNQTVPGHLAKRGATTSPVFDFTFDYNTALVRRDAGDFSVRMDFSNVPGYWDAVVDSPASSSSKRDLNQLVDRFYGSSDGWYTKFKSLKFPAAQGTKYTEKLDQLVYHNPQVCEYEGEQVGESLSIAMEGTTTVESHFGFSMIATWNPGESFEVHQAAGFFHPDGETDVTFKIGGEGVLDTSQSLQGSKITKVLGEASLAGKSIYKGWASFDMYRESSVSLRSSGGNMGAVAVDGYAESRIQSDWGRPLVNFPEGAVDSPLKGTSEGRRADDQVSTAEKDNILRPLAESPEGYIEVGTTTRVGIKMGLKFSNPWQSDVDGKLPDMSLSQSVYSRWTFKHDGAESCLTTSLGTTMQSHLESGSYVGWKSKETKTFVQELAKAGEKQCFTGDSKTRRDSIERRQLVNPNFDPDLYLPGINLGDGGWNNMAARIMCNGCGSCTSEGVIEEPCCGCACIPCQYGTLASVRDDDYYIFELSDQTTLSRRDLVINGSRGLQDEYGLDSEDKHQLVERQGTTHRISTPSKNLNICKTQITGPHYPSYPRQGPAPFLGPSDFEAHKSARNVMRYFHNSSQSCTNWAVGKFTNSDKVWNKNANMQHWQFYETEHPFEGQTISRFFNVHMTGVATVTRACPWILTWIAGRNAPWAGATENVAKLMSFELGSRDRQGRLAVFLSDSNWMKGAIVRGFSPIKTSRWDNMDAGDEQLAYLKELGMLFNYWNHPEVWQSFCDSYNGMRDILLQFDTWYSNNQGPSDLVGEWKKFNQAELKRIVDRGRASAQFLKETRKPVTGFWGWWWTLKWSGLFTYFPGNIMYQFGSIKLDQTCANLQ